MEVWVILMYKRLLKHKTKRCWVQKTAMNVRWQRFLWWIIWCKGYGCTDILIFFHVLKGISVTNLPKITQYLQQCVLSTTMDIMHLTQMRSNGFMAICQYLSMNLCWFLPPRASLMSSTVGWGLFLSRVYMDITIPGVQKPHWEPWALAIRSYKQAPTV